MKGIHMSNSIFAKSTRTFNPTTDHNARFAKKKLALNCNTIDAMLAYIENGGVITVCKSGKRSASKGKK